MVPQLRQVAFLTSTSTFILNYIFLKKTLLHQLLLHVLIRKKRKKEKEKEKENNVNEGTIYNEVLVNFPII